MKALAAFHVNVEAVLALIHPLSLEALAMLHAARTLCV